ncbi:MAG: DUF1479 family protein, partial [Gimesia sp.]|nr:DUF1479 family protein [Gimesia sp.]
MTQDYADQIEASKALLKRKIPDLSERFHAETQRLTLEVAAVKDEMNTGHAVIEIDYGEIINGAVTPDTIDRFKRRGVVVIRNVFDRDKVQEWNNELHHYTQSNQ